MYKPPSAIAPVLHIPGMIYQAGVYLRNRAFNAGLISAKRLSCPVVSVGNLTLGGTGKTPFVIYLAGLLKEMGHETAILTRGYGRQKSIKTIILKPEENADFTASILGDEPALMRRRLPEAWLGISSDRFYAANAIISQREQAKREAGLVFVLDDGFQRRAIRRDLDIVMIDSTQLPQAERLFPMGALREPVSELHRANIVVINRSFSPETVSTKNTCADDVTENLRKYAPETDFFYCVQRIQTFLPFQTWLDSGKTGHLPTMPGTAFLAAAIGNPDRFKRDVQNIGIKTRGCAFFKDHAAIGKNDWKACVDAARKTKADAIIITEKDAVKISSPPDFPLVVAVQNTELPEEERLREILNRVFERRDERAELPRQGQVLAGRL
jgi:tetraacyldisaccharide 4'-kinase